MPATAKTALVTIITTVILSVAPVNFVTTPDATTASPTKGATAGFVLTDDATPADADIA